MDTPGEDFFTRERYASEEAREMDEFWTAPGAVYRDDLFGRGSSASDDESDVIWG